MPTSSATAAADVVATVAAAEAVAQLVAAPLAVGAALLVDLKHATFALKNSSVSCALLKAAEAAAPRPRPRPPLIVGRATAVTAADAVEAVAGVAILPAPRPRPRPRPRPLPDALAISRPSKNAVLGLLMRLPEQAWWHVGHCQHAASSPAGDSLIVLAQVAWQKPLQEEHCRTCTRRQR